MTPTDEMGLTPEAAEGYENFFVPAIFQQWPPKLMNSVGLSAGSNLLEVGCGTGVLAREAVKLVGTQGSVTGIDLSESMLGVARRLAPEALFQQGDVQKLPFSDHNFDHVIASFVLMFVPDQITAIKEMWRVLKPGGKLAVSVWESLDNNPAYADLVNISQRLINKDAATSLAWPFALGADGALQSLLTEAGIGQADIRSHAGRAVFNSIDQFVRTEIQSWVLTDSVTDAALDAVVQESSVQLAHYCKPSGELNIPFNAIIAVAAKPG